MKNAGDIMSKDILTVRSKDSIAKTIGIMIDYKVSGLPVVNEYNEVIGVISENDLLTIHELYENNTGSGMDTHIMTVDTFMTPNPITIKQDMSIKDVSKILVEKRIKRLPVVDSSRILLGVVSRSDILKLLR
ncbi:MAG: CBS domain-containing protein [Candidatus Aureabacteria bacterium]|nr:CBS domain-containing protein [Candidatus Auribacterota bacterium]